MTRFLVLCLILTWANPTQAHKPSDSLLLLQRAGSSVEGQWDIALRDLDHAIGLDSDGDGSITWGELRRRHDAIARYALARLDVRSQDAACTLRPRDHLIDQHSDGAYAVLRFSVECPVRSDTLAVGYNLLFDLDLQHRGILRMGDSNQVFLFTATAREHDVTLLTADPIGSDSLRSGFASALQPRWLLILGVLALAVHRRRAGLAATVKIAAALILATSLTYTLIVLQSWSPSERFVNLDIVAAVVAVVSCVMPARVRFTSMLGVLIGLLHGPHLAAAFVASSAPTIAVGDALAFNAGGAIGIVLWILSLALLVEAARNARALRDGPFRGLLRANGAKTVRAEELR